MDAFQPKQSVANFNLIAAFLAEMTDGKRELSTNHRLTFINFYSFYEKNIFFLYIQVLLITLVQTIYILIFRNRFDSPIN